MNYEQNESVSGPLKENGVTSVLLIGSDSRTSGTEGRSDAMILITISDRTKTVHMTSLLRDMYVEIPGYEGNRLNAAYAYGGPELLMETINQNLGTEVYHYAVVNFEAFANLVDAVGGVELELTNEEAVSYTPLDVYKRQALTSPVPSSPVRCMRKFMRTGPTCPAF